MKSSFIAFKRGDCPICHGAKKGCKGLGDLVLCRDFSANPGSDWTYRKETKDGIWGIWARGGGEDRREYRPAYAPKVSASTAPSVPSWDVADRDVAYRAIAEATGLYFQHRRNIAKRPHVTDQEIDTLVSRGWLFSWPGGQNAQGAGVGLPGVKGNGRLMGRSTWAIGAPDILGQIAGVQLRNPEGGYFWASAPRHGGATPHVNEVFEGLAQSDGGELPLGVYGTVEDALASATIEFGEGFLKPALTHIRYGGMHIGMAGGRWADALGQLKNVVASVGAENIEYAILNADGGAIHNGRVMNAYRALERALGDSFCPSIPLMVRWWDQTEKSHGDIDEISPETYHGAELLTWAEFEALSPHRELSDREKAQQRRAQRIDAERRAWLAGVASVAGMPEDSDRDAIASAFHAQHTLSGPSEVGVFDDLEFPEDRTLTILDGSKMTRKTSTALRSVVREGEERNASGVIYAPTRVLARSLARVLGAYTVDQYMAMPEGYRPSKPWIVACPESAWKLTDLEFDVVIFDEPNESLPRAQSGILGNRPRQSRAVIRRQLRDSLWCVLAQDGIYRPTVATVQRWGEFTPDQVQTIRRERTATAMEVVLYHGAGGATEAWDGTALSKAPDIDIAFYSWFDGIVEAIKAGRRVIIPCGAEGKGRAIHRVLRSLFPEKKGQTIDGKYTPQGVRSAFADNPSMFAESRNLDWLIYSPTFDSGVSIEGTYFDAQFEYVRAFEPATNASQRGERYRDAIKGEKLTQRHVYIAHRGLPSMPPVAVFTPDYWRALLTHPADTEAINLAQQIGGDDLVQRLDRDAPEDWLELPQFMAIAAREVYFKRELLTQEWRRNGWTITPAAVSPGAAGEWSEVFYRVGQGIIAQKARAWAKAKPKALDDGAEVSGAIEATKAHKWEVAQQLGPDFALLNTPEFAESWVIAGDGALQAAQVRALVAIAHTKPDLWQAIGQGFALSTVATVAGADQPTPDLPCSHRVHATARLLATAPGLWEIISGATPEWTNKAPAILALASWARQNAHALGRFSAHAQRIHGLQFTAKTPAVKCAHKLLEMVGLDAQSLGRIGNGGREWKYRLATMDDLAAKAATAGKRPHEPRRRLYRESTQSEVTSALAAVIEAKALAPEWAALKADLLARHQASTTSVKENLTTEVVDGTLKPTHRWSFMGLNGWVDRIEDGIKATFRTVAGTIYALTLADLEVIT